MHMHTHNEDEGDNMPWHMFEGHVMQQQLSMCTSTMTCLVAGATVHDDKHNR